MNLDNVLDELQKYKRDKKTLLSVYIQDRLNRSLLTYYKQLTSSIRYYDRKDELRILKKLGETK